MWIRPSNRARREMRHSVLENVVSSLSSAGLCKVSASDAFFIFHSFLRFRRNDFSRGLLLARSCAGLVAGRGFLIAPQSEALSPS